MSPRAAAWLLAAVLSGPAASAAATRTAVLCESEVWLDYGGEADRVMVHESRRVAERILQAAGRAVGRTGRSAGPLVYASTGILVDPSVEHRLAWERPRRERTGEPPFGRAPFHLDARVAVSDSTVVDWMDLVRRTTVGDASAAEAAVRLARETGCDEVLVIVATSTRTTKRESLAGQGNPFSGLFDDESVLQAWTKLDWALYDGREGTRRWSYSRSLEGWNANSRRRLGDWTGAAIASLPPPGADVRSPELAEGRFRAPFRTEMAYRVGAGGAGSDYPAFFLGLRGGWLVRPWWSLGYQLDGEIGLYERRELRGDGELAGAPFEMRRPLEDPELGAFPLHAVTQFQFPRAGRIEPYAGVSGGYTIGTLEAAGYEFQFFGGWSWGAHAGVRWRSDRSGGGFGLELGYLGSRPERDGSDPGSGAPVRERLDLAGWSVLLSLTMWE